MSIITLGPASLRLGVPQLKLASYVRGRTDLPGVSRAGRFHVVDVSKLEELRQVLREEGLIRDGAEHLVPQLAGAGVGGEGDAVEML